MKRFMEITKASGICLIVYIFSYMFLAAFLEDGMEFFTVIASILYGIIFCYIYIWLNFIRDGSGYKEVFSKYKDQPYNILDDIRFVVRNERITILFFVLINIGCWILTNLDKIIFGKKTVTAIFLIYAPLNLIGEVLPNWCGNILGYIVGTFTISVIYLLELVVLRRKWYK